MSDWFRSYGYAEVYPDLIVGAYPLDAGDVGILELMRVERVLNLVEDSEYKAGSRADVEDALRAAGIEETRLSLIDFGHLPADQLEDAVSTLVGWLKDGVRAYVHCRAGWQRSASVAAGAVAVFDGVSIQDALREIQSRKPTADPLPHQRRDLADWFEGRGSARVA